MLNLHKFGRNCLVILAISSLNTTLVENPVQASYVYTCQTSKFLVNVTRNSHGQLIYRAFEGNYKNRPRRDPDLVLYNGKIVSQKTIGNGGDGTTLTVFRWGAAGGYIYQISEKEEPGGESGELLVKQKGKVLYREECAVDEP